MFNRGVKTPQQAEAFLARDQSMLHDPFLLPQMQEAVARISDALSTEETIGIFGDFDADGVTGTALLAEGLASLGGKIIPYLPHRTLEGHGLNIKAIEKLSELGVSLIVTVDNGTTSIDEISWAASLGVDTIVTDHHLPTSILPSAVAVVNPKLPGSGYPFHYLAGVGLAFKLVQALHIYLGRYWNENLLQLAAIGTVTDVVPMIGENRYIVSAGLDSINRNPVPGIKELLRIAGESIGYVDEESLAFTIGPRINAPGRMEHALSSYSILRASSLEEAVPLAEKIENINRERQNATRLALEKLSGHLGSDISSYPLICIWDDEFKAGISGLLASRLVDEYYRPSIVVAIEGDLARGSARSIDGFDIADALMQCNDLLLQFGGHQKAAGFTVKKENLDLLKERLLEIAGHDLELFPKTPVLKIDAHVRLQSLMGANYQFMNDLAPYGEDNRKPVFLTRDVKILGSRKVGKLGEHLILRLEYGGAFWEAIAFGRGADAVKQGDRIDIVYKLGVDKWKPNRPIRLMLEDFRPVDSTVISQDGLSAARV
jgi:single-stranded-DNA-specific exonuclease